MIYLDYAATSFRKPPSVYEAVRNVLKNGASAGRGGYPAAELAAEAVYDCRAELNELFHGSGEENVVFTYNATMALNMAIKGLLPDGGEAVISGFEHNAVVRPLQTLSDRKGVTVTVAKAPLFEPEAQIEAFSRCIGENTRLVVCTQESNVFGYLLPIRELDALCFERGVPLIIDASQSAGSVETDFGSLKAAKFLCCPGHKGLYGPQGTGVLICRNGQAETLIEGGTGSESRIPRQPTFLPDRFEAGTLNAAGIAGLGQGVRFVRRIGAQNILVHEQALIEYVAEGLREIPGVRVWYGGKERQGGVLSFICEGIACEDAAERLAKVGIAVRAGLHCAPLAHETAGTGESGTVRVSVSAFSDTRELEALVFAVRRLLK